MSLPTFPSTVQIASMRSMTVGDCLMYEAVQHVRATIAGNISRTKQHGVFTMQTLVMVDPQTAESKKVLCLTRKS